MLRRNEMDKTGGTVILSMPALAYRRQGKQAKRRISTKTQLAPSDRLRFFDSRVASNAEMRRDTSPRE
jgi:hypothetical protein